MATAVALVSMLGVRPNVSGGLSYVDETDVQYVCGRNLIRFDTETRSQKILHGSADALGITALAVGGSGKQRMSAYAELGSDRHPVVIVYDWATRKRKRTITGLDSGSAPVTHLAFTCDGKSLVIQTGGPEWNLHYVLFDRGGAARVVATARNVTVAGKAVTHVECHPSDPYLISVAGRGFLKFLRLVDDALRPVQVNLRRDPVVFSCQVWLPEDKLVIGTVAGELWLLEGTEFKRVLTDASTVAGSAAIVNKPVTSLVAFPKGFIAGFDGGFIRIFEKSDDPRLFFKHTKTFTIGGDDVSRIVAMSVSPNDEDLAILCSSAQSYSFKLSSYELYKPGDLAFKPLVSLFHSQPPAAVSGSPSATEFDIVTTEAVTSNAQGRRGSISAVTNASDPWAQPNYGITGMDTCIRKPLFVTSGVDRTIRIWNYLPVGSGELPASGALTHRVAETPGELPDLTPSLELVQRFSETPATVAMHPTGLHLLVGFESSLQLLNVLMDSLKMFKEFPIRNCSEAHFSHSGAMFGAVNGSIISVYNTYTCAPVATLRAHSDRVLAFTWSRDDKFIVSVGRDGMVIRYAVIVPNAASSTPGAPSAIGSGSYVPTNVGERTAAVVAVGKAVNSQEIRDFLPLSITTGAMDNGREVVVSGILTKNGTVTSVLRTMDLAAPSRDGPKADVPMAGHVCRSLYSFGTSRLVLAGMGNTLDRKNAGDGKRSGDEHGTLQPAEARGLGERSPSIAISGSALTGEVQTQSAAALPAVAAPFSDSAGVIRAYKTSMNNEYTDLVCHSAPIIRMACTHDGKFMFTASSDATIAVLAIVDGRPKSSGAGAAAAAVAANDDSLPFADEILVTRADLEDVRKEKIELEARVQEIIMTNKYNERYKEMTNDEKIREIDDKFAEELRSDRAKHDSLRQAKVDMEAKFEEELGDMEAAHARELEELEFTYRSKITAEMERYDSLVKDRDTMNEEFDASNAALVQEHAGVVERLKAKYEASISAEQDTAGTLDDKKRTYQEDYDKAANDIEGDVDAEMEDLRARYERKLQAESKATLLLQGENGFWKHKFVKANREMQDKKDEMNGLADKEKELHEAIAALQKDVQGHKKEIRERDETIADKEGRIYDLKKKNQELEKFKFVLNYKIQELKRQIMPRKREIQDMREQMKEMELELLQYHKSNAALDLMIGELKLKRDGMQREVDKLQTDIDAKDDDLKKISRDVAAVHSVAKDTKALRAAVTRLYHKYIHGDSGNLAAAVAKMEPSGGEDATKRAAPAGVDVADVQKELARQRLYLERNIESLKRKMEKDDDAARVDHARLMRENMVLTQEINELRRDYRYMQAEFAKTNGEAAAEAAALDVSAIDPDRAAEELGLVLASEQGFEESKLSNTPAFPSDALEAHVASAPVPRVASASTQVRPPQPVAFSSSTRRTAAKFGVTTASEGLGVSVVGRPHSVGRPSGLIAAGSEALRTKVAQLRLHA